VAALGGGGGGGKTITNIDHAALSRSWNRLITTAAVIHIITESNKTSG